MRRIAIVGAGQAGLQLALGLREYGHEVTLVSDRTAEEIRSGRVLSTQAMFGPALQIEREAGLHLWERQTPSVRAVRTTVIDPPGEAALAFTGWLDQAGQSVDQRVKVAGWLELLQERGGRVEYGTVDRAGLRRLADRHELTIVAAGRGELSGIFPRDEARSPFDRPQRTLSCVYLHGVQAPPAPAELHTRIVVVPGVGEAFLQPALTTSGTCTILLWEAVPGGPFDCWQDRPAPHDHLERSLRLLREYAPWEHALCAEAEPTDKTCTLYGAVTPVVRHPVARLEGGGEVLGMADAVALNDPVTGQGANNAARCAAGYLRAIDERGDAPFDAPWMHETFEAFWQHARHAAAFSAAMLGPLPGHLQRVLAAAAENEQVARRFAAVYADPSQGEWLLDPAVADAYLASVR